MGALRSLGRFVAGCSRLLTQEWSGVSCSIRSSLCSLDGSSAIRSPLSLFADSSETISSSTCGTAGMPGPRVSFLRTLGTYINNRREGADGKLHMRVRSEAGGSLTSAEYKDWLARSPDNQRDYLAALPVADQWQSLERLEASGLRPSIRLWEKALHNLQRYSSTSLEGLCRRVGELWERGYSPDVVMYTDLLFACRKECQLLRAFELYGEMTARSVVADEIFFRTLARVLASFYNRRAKGEYTVTSSEKLIHVEAFLEAMSTSKVIMNLEIAYLLLTVIRNTCNERSLRVQSSGIALANHILDSFHSEGIKVSDRICATVIDCYAMHREGDMNRALVILREMESFGDEVGAQTYATVIKGYARRQEFDQVDFYLRLMDTKKLGLFGSAVAMVVEAYLAQGCFTEAENCFREAEVKGQVTQVAVLAHIRTLTFQRKLQEILEVTKKHVGRFNWTATGRPAALVPILLEALAHCPTEEGREVICQALEVCPSIQASMCARLLRDSSVPSWDAFYQMADAFKSWQGSTTELVIQSLSDCFWGLGMRNHSVKRLAWAKDNELFSRVFRRGMSGAGPGSPATLDLHSLSINTAKAVVLVTLKDISEKAGGGESPCGLRLITGQRTTGSMYVEVPRMLQEYGFCLSLVFPLPHEGGFKVSRTAMSRWLKSLT